MAVPANNNSRNHTDNSILFVTMSPLDILDVGFVAEVATSATPILLAPPPR
jgi:hypothetical protein